MKNKPGWFLSSYCSPRRSVLPSWRGIHMLQRFLAFIALLIVIYRFAGRV